MRKIVVGSRTSNLALTQTDWVIERMQKLNLPIEFEVKEIMTKGDRILDVTLSKVGGKGIFVKEIERAMLSGEIDMAVHSMKDMPSSQPEGLIIASVPKRADYRDAFISHTYESLASMPSGAIVGTSSLRRAAQVLAKRPDLVIKPLRGNVETRLRKLKEEEFDAIILAAAGLERIGKSEETIQEYLSFSDCLPAVGQGALAIQCRSTDQELIDWLENINDDRTMKVVSAERSFQHTLEGGCQVPMAAYADVGENNVINIRGLVANADGTKIIKENLQGDDPIALGKSLAEKLIARGAKTILDEFKEDSNE